jgi:hypothetical protein
MTYAEWTLRHDRYGKPATLVNMMSQANGVIDDMMAVECQSGNAFEYTQVVGLPTPSRRVYNQGVKRTIAQVAKLTATTKEYADQIVMDRDIVDINGSGMQVRADEDMIHMQALQQKLASDIFYGNANVDPAQFTGLANIYNTVNLATSGIAKNVIDCGGTGSVNTSLWLVNWGPKQIHTIFPKGTQAGIFHQDFGLVPNGGSDANGNTFPAYMTWISWKIGLAIHDWRQAVRACNIDVPGLVAGTGTNLIHLLGDMVHKLPVQPVGAGPVNMSDAVPEKIVINRPVFYCDRTVLHYLDRQASDKTNVLLRMEEWGGMPVLTYRSIPIRCVDALLDTEARVL